MSFATVTSKLTVFNYTKNHIEEIVKCKASFVYFVDKFIKIHTTSKGTVPFQMFKYQRILANNFQKSIGKSKIILKPRQMGISTLMYAYMLWRALFFPESTMLYITLKARAAKESMRKLKNMWKNLPEFLQLDIINGNRKNEGTITQLIFSNNSIISIEGATEDTGRSGTYSEVFCDEFAFWRLADTVWASLTPSMSTGGSFIIASTAFGMGNLFYKLWTSALQKTNDFLAYKLHYSMHPLYNEAWAKAQRKALGEKIFAQEILCDFLTSGYNVFDMAKIKEIQQRLFELIPINVFDDDTCFRYFDPEGYARYVIGADISSGRSRDNSAWAVYDIDNMTQVEAGRVSGMNPIAFSRLLMDRGYYWHTAILAPEANTYGEGVVAHMQEQGYPNIYSDRSIVKDVNNESDTSDVYGWFTTGKTRNLIITGFDNALSNDEVEVNDPFFVEEANTFVYDKFNRASAKNKKGTAREESDEVSDGITYTDDNIFANCIARHVASIKAKESGYLPFAVG